MLDHVKAGVHYKYLVVILLYLIQCMICYQYSYGDSNIISDLCTIKVSMASIILASKLLVTQLNCALPYQVLTNIPESRKILRCFVVGHFFVFIEYKWSFRCMYCYAVLAY